MAFFYKILLIIDKKKFDDIFASKIFIKKLYFYKKITYIDADYLQFFPASCLGPFYKM